MKYSYSVKRSDRRSVSIKVTQDNEIFVRCPLNMTDEEVDKFLEKKSAWIDKHLNANAPRLDEIRSVINRENVYVNGELLPVVICGWNEITPTAVFMTEKGNFRKLIEDKFTESFYAEVRDAANEMGLNPRSVKVKRYVSRWGCCSSEGDIGFNYVLFMASPELRRYVIIHELSHLKYMNHSKYFWALVKKYDPDWNNHRNQLKNFNYIPASFA